MSGLGAPAPTPAVSGIGTTTAGDLAYVIDRLAQVDRAALLELALGSLPGDGCRVCEVFPYPPVDQVAADLRAWHGNDAIRCGVIYGVAAALLADSAPSTGMIRPMPESHWKTWHDEHHVRHFKVTLTDRTMTGRQIAGLALIAAAFESNDPERRKALLGGPF